jgi:hypothetical protein
MSAWRSIGRYRALADWVRALRGKSGVYLIRSVPSILNLYTSSVLYIGESHTAKLYETLTRHFQHWEGRTSGPTFAHSQVEVRVIVTKPARAVELQDKLICRYKPERNRTDPCDTSDVPF